MKAVLAALVGGALMFLAYGVGDVWPLAFVAPAPLLWLAYGEQKLWKAGLAAFAAFLIGQMNLIGPYGKLVVVFLPALCIMALVFMLCVLFARLAGRRLPLILAVFAFPAAWTAWEYASSLDSMNGSYGALAYGLTAAPWAIQSASVFGLWSITFLICTVSSALALAAHKPRAAAPALAAAAVLFTANAGFGFWRLAQPVGPTVRVGLVVDDSRDDAFVDGGRAAVSATTFYAGQARRLAAGGARYIVLPEKFAHLSPTWREAALAPLQAASNDTGVIIVAGFDEKAALRRNLAMVFRPALAPFAYAKRHMVPGLESVYAPGDASGVFAPRQAVVVCKDLDFQAMLRRDAQAHIGLMLAPAWDFDKDDWAHARLAVMRGVEGGFTLVRAARQGYLSVTDAQGRIVGLARGSRSGPVRLITDVAVGPADTPYLHLGDVFAWVAAAGAVLLLGAALARGKR